MDLAKVVQTNLVHYNLWADVEVVQLGALVALRGSAPNALPGATTNFEYVVPVAMASGKTSMAEMDSWFAALGQYATRPPRVVLALVNDDGTVVYYFVSDGVSKPRQN